MLRLPCEKFTGLRNAYAGLRNGFPGMRNSYARLHNAHPGVHDAYPWLPNFYAGLHFANAAVGNADAGLHTTDAGLRNADAVPHREWAGMHSCFAGSPACIICNPEPSCQAILFCHKGGRICECAVPSCIRGRPTRRVLHEARWPSGTPQRLLHPVARHGRRMLPDGSNRVVAGSAAA